MVLVGTRCVYKVILAEIVHSGSQFMTKFDQIFYQILIDLIISKFCITVLFQDNPNLVEAGFV